MLAQGMRLANMGHRTKQKFSCPLKRLHTESHRIPLLITSIDWVKRITSRGCGREFTEKMQENFSAYKQNPFTLICQKGYLDLLKVFLPIYMESNKDLQPCRTE